METGRADIQGNLSFLPIAIRPIRPIRLIRPFGVIRPTLPTSPTPCFPFLPMLSVLSVLALAVQHTLPLILTNKLNHYKRENA